MGRTRVSPDGREVAALVSALPAGRFVLGLSGSPGAGKSTLAAALAATYGIPVVPMDGFHRPRAELETMGRLDAKGAPDTFDAEAYAALLASLHTGRTVLAPAFDHRLPDPTPEAIEVPAGAGLVVTEGNYLLVDEPRWRAVREQLDAVWHLIPDELERVERLVRRHIEVGRDDTDARAWVDRVDQANADLVEAAAGHADEVLDLTDWGGEVHVAPAGLPPDRVEVEHHVDADEPGEDGLHSYRYEYDLIWISVGSARILARRYSDTPQQASLMSIEENGGRRFIHAVDLTSPLVAAAVAYLSSIGVEDVQRLGGGSGYAPVDL
jgi:pantothenate kinase